MLRALTQWPKVRWVAAVAGTLVVLGITGLPSVMIENPLFRRMTPTLWWNYPVWVASAVLTGLLVATYVARMPGPSTRSGAGFGATALSVFAVGCPVCNKLVVAAVGVSGALNLWAPIQPVLGVLSIALLTWALHLRTKGERSCPAPGSERQKPLREEQGADRPDLSATYP